MCLGFAMPDNFRFPYAAIGFSDFWRRWHITLSSWLRDYLYIPLGGNRHGPRRTYAALMATMLLGGLWHGANWTFVAWGGLHGIYLSAERWLRKRFAGFRPNVWALLALGLITYALVNVTWVFFRAKTFSRAWTVLRGMFGGNASPVPLLGTESLVMVAAIIAGLVITHWLMRNRTLESVLARAPAAALGRPQRIAVGDAGFHAEAAPMPLPRAQHQQRHHQRGQQDRAPTPIGNVALGHRLSLARAISSRLAQARAQRDPCLGASRPLDNPFRTGRFREYPVLTHGDGLRASAPLNQGG
jgi:hypothetical protein